jgi:Family of unknown function (DUF5990)/Domain of unknown function (DUF5655)
MSQLPDRPNLDQLRRQARELLRAAVGGDASALRRLQSVSQRVTLSAAQLAIAREYGFASWPRLRAEVERSRQAALAAPPPEPAARPEPPAPAEPPVESWQRMRDQCAQILLARTGEDVGAWNRRIAEAGLDDEGSLRAWLAEREVTGYAQALLVWERFGYPDFLTADAAGLVAGQYADRPHLRPILDAVLAAVPAFGPVTVQARKTCVSLVSPRRTFAAVQATTKSRVDLGLRLDGAEPCGRLAAAKNIASGTINVKIALTSPDDLDDETLGWLRRAYEESTTPPPPRRRAPRPRPVSTSSLTVVVEGTDLPGRSCGPNPEGNWYNAVHVGLLSDSKDVPGLRVPGRPSRAIELVPGDAPSARWEFEVTVNEYPDGLDFRGPFVRGARDDRSIGLAWGDVHGDGTFLLFRGAKLRFADIGSEVIAAAMRPGHQLVARVRLTNENGMPICARVRPPHIAWFAEPTSAAPAPLS